MATGPALRERVLADGFEHAELVLGRGEQRRALASRDQPEEERAAAGLLRRRRGGDDRDARATRSAGAIRHALAACAVARRLEGILAAVRAAPVVVDHLAFGATLALRALEPPYVSLLPSHPCQLPPPGDPDGFPVRFPARARAARCRAGRAARAVRAPRTAASPPTYNGALLALDPSAAPVGRRVSHARAAADARRLPRGARARLRAPGRRAHRLARPRGGGRRRARRCASRQRPAGPPSSSAWARSCPRATTPWPRSPRRCAGSTSTR